MRVTFSGAPRSPFQTSSLKSRGAQCAADLDADGQAFHFDLPWVALALVRLAQERQPLRVDFVPYACGSSVPLSRRWRTGTFTRNRSLIGISRRVARTVLPGLSPAGRKYFTPELPSAASVNASSHCAVDTVILAAQNPLCPLPQRAAFSPEPQPKTYTQEAFMPVKPVPEGFHTLTPNLVFKNAAGAIDFYIKVFGAKELSRVPTGHAARSCMPSCRSAIAKSSSTIR